MLRILLNALILLLLASPYTMAQNSNEEMLRSGKLLFQVNCSRCHGMLGDGGTGPSLNRAYLPRASTDEKLANVITNGISGTGMPAAWTFTDIEVEKVVTYIRHLGRDNETVIIGDIENGKALFDNSVCFTCHIVSGNGGSLGPDLTRVGLKRGQEYLVASISHPGKNQPIGSNGFFEFLVVNVALKSGEIITGVRVNEDTFSIQIKDASNRLYSFKKADILSIEKNKDKSLMPSFNDQFSASELNDIAAYLTSLK